jgi:hypothetical protein
MEVSSLSSIIVILIIIFGVYLVFTDQVQGKVKLIVIVFLAFLSIFIISNLSMFKSYKAVLDAPSSGDKEIVFPASKMPKITSNYSISTWIYIQDWNVGFGNEKNIVYYELSNDKSVTLSLDGYDNKLLIKYYTFSSSGSTTAQEIVNIENINIQKWVNITVCFDTNNVDTYINGKLTDTHIHNNPLFVPKEQGLIKLCKDNVGFSGKISNTKYYNKIIPPQEIWDIYRAGYSDSLLGNLLNRYNATFIFEQDNNEVAKYILL